MTLNLNGLIPATVLPMDADGRIDEPALRSYIGWVVAQGPVALAINVDTGEGPHLTHDEKVRVIQIVRDMTDLPIVAGLAGPSTEAAVRQATEFKAAGAERVAVLPDPGLPERAARPARCRSQYHEAIAQVGLPLILFQLQPALARAELRARHAAGDGVGRGRRRDQGGVVRRAAVRRHGAPARGAAAEDHAADRQRQLHPRVVHAGRDWRADRVRGGDDPRAGRHDRRVAGTAGSTRRGRSVVGSSGSPTSCSRAPVGDYRVRLKECLRILGVLENAHVRKPLLPISDQERAFLAQVLTEVGLLREPIAAALGPSATWSRRAVGPSGTGSDGNRAGASSRWRNQAHRRVGGSKSA